MKPGGSSRYAAMFVPKLYTVLREGYSWGDFRADAIAGLTVAIVALPLAMALAIASGTGPEKGLYTAVIAGFLVSALGGSRVQISGPTAAFIPVVFVVIEKFGFGGIILCTLLAGLMLVAAGLLRLGTLMKYMPQPVITGFTAGIAVSIFASQVKDVLGLQMDSVPAEFFARWSAYAQHLHTFQPAAVLMTAAGLMIIVSLRRWRPAWPGFLIALLACTAASMWFSLPAETISSRFGALPSAAVESLLSAVVADGMTGGRHRSNGELVAQGVANVASSLFGGLPATGAIARTATNVRAGARSPVAGMLHAIFIMLFMLMLSPLMGYVPLPALAAILLIVAWNMSEIEHFRQTMSAPWGDRLVLLLTFTLTVLFDLTLAIQAGVVVAAFVFMFRMSEAVEVSNAVQMAGDDPEMDEQGAKQVADDYQRSELPKDVEVFRLNGPLFFGSTSRLDSLLDQFFSTPRALILRMRLVPFIDASGVHALKNLAQRCKKRNIVLVVSGLQPQPARVIADMHLNERAGELHFVGDYEAAPALATTLVHRAIDA